MLPTCTVSAFLPTCRPFWSIRDPLIDATMLQVPTAAVAVQTFTQALTSALLPLLHTSAWHADDLAQVQELRGCLLHLLGV